MLVREMQIIASGMIMEEGESYRTNSSARCLPGSRPVNFYDKFANTRAPRLVAIFDNEGDRCQKRKTRSCGCAVIFILNLSFALFFFFLLFPAAALGFLVPFLAPMVSLYRHRRSTPYSGSHRASNSHWTSTPILI
jgi:hypothetical protein